MLKHLLFLLCSVCLFSCSSSKDSYRAFDKLSDVEDFMDKVFADGDAETFFYAADSSGVPEEVLKAIEESIPAMSESFANFKYDEKLVFDYPDYLKYREEKNADMSEWMRSVFKPMTWNYTPDKVIVYESHSPGEQSFTIYIGVVERKSKYVIVCTYWEPDSSAE
ncbi:hypothetical protein Rhal01_02571 [Rubritalea halochordaticola]|uniref:Uncharacterized protein n=1 Tax=Rubritalea halochordaticola TaxID=714537 RepID=A0ABP9V134_9BACT